MHSDPRYDGKPLLRLIELYVLKAIGELSQAREDNLNATVTPKLQATFGGAGRWHDAIEAAVGMDADTPQQLRDMWARNQKVARAHRVTLTPREFAEMVADENFPFD